MHDIWNPWHGCVKCSEGCQHLRAGCAEVGLFVMGAVNVENAV